MEDRMNAHAWQQPVSPGDAYRRAGGRRRLNASRKLKAEVRRFKVVPLLRSGHSTREMAEALGVSPSTIRRDVAALLGAGVIAVVPHR
jgi:DNA-binding NarL/FixJ family response regulator